MIGIQPTKLIFSSEFKVNTVSNFFKYCITGKVAKHIVYLLKVVEVEYGECYEQFAAVCVPLVVR